MLSSKPAIFVLALLLPTCLASEETSSQSIFCIFSMKSNETTEVSSDLPRIASDVSRCLDFCLNKYFRYAGMQNGALCICYSFINMQSSENCKKLCPNSNQSCGGDNAVSIYSTGRLLPGPPERFSKLQATETGFALEWSPPQAINSNKLIGYSVKAVPFETYSSNSLPPYLEWNYLNSTLKAELTNLHPGTLYNVSISAENEHGPGAVKSIEAWTSIGDPPAPESPVIVEKGSSNIIVRLKPVKNENGPITAYLIVVSLASGGFFEPLELKSWPDAHKEDLQYYITAELRAQDLTEEKDFVVGDGKSYGRYFNQPLSSVGDVKVALGIVSTLSNVTKKSFSSYHNRITVFKVGSTNDDGDVLALILTSAIVVCCVLLLISVAVFLYLQRYYSKRQRSQRFSNQEIPLRGPILELENQAYIHDGFLFEEEEERVNHYQRLKDQIWNIPPNFLGFSDDMMGRGSFGKVTKGTVQLKGIPVPVAIHVIADSRLSKSAKKTMLGDLDLLLRAGCAKKLDHLVALIGVCETPDSLYVILEHHPVTLKDILLESRSLTHNNALDHFCSLNSAFLFQVMIGIARGMQYLEQNKIVHTRLACRSILMEGGMTPKVSAFGLAHYSKTNEELDYSRWTAQEIFRSRHFSIRSDVWSYGCVMWEITALGGTPYHNVESHDVASHVMRGSRLPQLAYVADELYQWMLLCWQLDLDERPSFQTSILSLQSMAVNANNLVNFTVYPGFRYEPYNLSQEIKYGNLS